MENILRFLFWLAQSIFILFIFWFTIPSLINAYTRNSWLKIPVMILFSVIAGIFMAWLRYTPGLLVVVWLFLTHHTIEAMKERKFIREAHLKINKPLFYLSSYLYVIMACFLAYFFQAEVVPIENPLADGIPLWKDLLGIK